MKPDEILEMLLLAAGLSGFLAGVLIGYVLYG